MSIWWRILDLRRELDQLPDDETRRRIWAIVEPEGDAQVKKGWAPVLTIALAVVVVQLVAVFAFRAVGWRYRGMIQAPFLLIGVLLGSFASFCFFRRRYQVLLRREISRAGTPLCLACGYNLTGIESPQCPECGAAVQPRAAPGDAAAPSSPLLQTPHSTGTGRSQQ